MRPKPVVLMVLDGWGVGPTDKGNAVTKAETPYLDSYFSYFPSVSLQAGGISVGLPWGDVGNSEVGHTTIGAGTVLYQNSPRISIAIQNQDFFRNKELKQACRHAKQKKSKLHLVGLVSPGGVHSNYEHLLALLDLAKRERIKEVYVHAILDGRDADADGSKEYVADLQKEMKKRGVGQIATMVGRYYAMDRNNNWDRTERAYNLMTGSRGEPVTNALEAINASYNNGVFDEQFEPTVLVDKKNRALGQINDDDAIIFFNFRADRARQLTKAIALPGFDKFDRPKYLRNIFFVTMTDYEEALPVSVAFPALKAKTPLAKVLSERGFRQLHVAETEKYAHVTYFFNGGEEKPFLNEDRILVPSKPVSNYAETPPMSAYQITDKVFDSVKSGMYDFILVNYANPDMLGHTGNMDATIQGIEVLDGQIARIVDLVASVGGAVFLTGDHGNAESMLNAETQEIEKEHTANPVPFIMISSFNGFQEPLNLKAVHEAHLSPAGVLADVAPTILDVMELPKPPDMSGESLLQNLVPQKGASHVVVG